MAQKGGKSEQRPHPLRQTGGRCQAVPALWVDLLAQALLASATNPTAVGSGFLSTFSSQIILESTGAFSFVGYSCG